MSKFNLSIVSDNTKKTFKVQADLVDFIEELTEKTEIKTFTVSTLSIIHESSSEGLFVEAIADLLGVEDAPLEAIQDTLSSGKNDTPGSQMLLVERLKSGQKVVHLLSDYSVRTLAERAEALSSGFFKNLGKKEQETVLNIHARNVPLDRLSSAVKRGYKWRSFRGPEFVELSQYKLLVELIKTMNKDFGGPQFEKATFTHNETKAEWLLPTQLDLVGKYNEYISEALGEGEYFLPMIEFATSDLGLLAATVKASLVSDERKIGIGTPIKVLHKDDASEDDFIEDLDYLFSRINSNVESVMRLATITVNNPGNAALYIYSDVVRGVGKVPLRHAVELYHDKHGTGPGTAHDVFFILQDALVIMKSKGRAESSIESTEEDLLKLLSEKFPWSTYDLKTTPEL